ncbi:MAG: AMP-binding protein [Gammaproteobacteria bacterium]
MPHDQIPLIHAYQPAAPIMFSGGQTVSQQNFIARVMVLSEQLPDSPYLINLCRDRYNFALVFCAALVKGMVNLLPSNRQFQTLEEVAADYPGCCALIDNDENLPEMVTIDLRVNTEHNKLVNNELKPDLPWINGEQLAAIAFTSGTTGKPSPNAKLWRSLVDTTRLLATRLMTAAERPVIVATMPSQHMYGLEMTLMMALHGGCILDSRHPFFADDIASTLASLPNPQWLVTTPVHLNTLLGANIKIPGVTKIISATAPLSREQADKAEKLFGAPLEEIYGCTEAGSMATRRTINDLNWTLLEGLSFKQNDTSNDGAMRIHGPHLTDFVTVEDRIELVDQHRFRLLGRSQDMINVGGKRASLADLTLKLLSIDGVDDGIIFMADELEETTDQRPLRPVAFVVSQLSLQTIRIAMSQKIDPVFLPRPIKKVTVLPRNATGKLSNTSLQQLLQQSEVVKLFFNVPQTHPCFPGHFPTQPIVPGALLMHWIFDRVRDQYRSHTIVSVKSMKFLKSLQPGDPCELELNNDAASRRLNIACRCHSELVCKGVIELAPTTQVPEKLSAGILPSGITTS